MMKAVVHERFGSPDVLQFEEVEKPTPDDDAVLVEIRAVSANPADWHTMRADPFFIRFTGDGLFKPKHKILGIDISGRVDAIGRNVTEFQPGDEVFGTSRWGGFAEYACARQDRLVHKPPSLSFEQAAAVPVAAVSALQGLRFAGPIQPGQTVLIHGASGGVGTFAVQIAKAYGAVVTGVCSTGNLDMVRSLGAHRVVDYTKEDVTLNGERYDLILDTAAYRSLFDYRRSLKRDGTYVLVGGSVSRLFQVPLLKLLLAPSGRKAGLMLARITKSDLRILKDLLESGKVVPVIDRRYPLAQTAGAIRYLEAGHARGKVIVTV